MDVNVKVCDRISVCRIFRRMVVLLKENISSEPDGTKVG